MIRLNKVFVGCFIFALRSANKYPCLAAFLWFKIVKPTFLSKNRTVIELSPRTATQVLTE